ncbi:MAG: hypothetical protein ACP5JO_02150, partial [Candidatus Ratteibacteria bacterium]
GMQNINSAYLWVYDNSIFNSRVPAEKEKLIDDAKLVVEIFEPGIYRVEFWDTYKGRKFSEFEKKFDNGECEILLPAFTKDIAIKIEKES